MHATTSLYISRVYTGTQVYCGVPLECSHFSVKRKKQFYTINNTRKRSPRSPYIVTRQSSTICELQRSLAGRPRHATRTASEERCIQPGAPVDRCPLVAGAARLPSPGFPSQGPSYRSPQGSTPVHDTERKYLKCLAWLTNPATISCLLTLSARAPTRLRCAYVC